MSGTRIRVGVGGLAVHAAVVDGRPVVAGQWGGTGFGYSTTAMRACAAAILAACDDADAMVSTETELST